MQIWGRCLLTSKHYIPRKNITEIWIQDSQGVLINSSVIFSILAKELVIFTVFKKIKKVRKIGFK